VNKELNAGIRNKLQSIKTALDLFSQAKNMPKEFIEKALRDLDEVEGLLKGELFWQRS